MKTLSIRQPWAWAILNLGKDVENRTWRSHYTGPLLIHAGQQYDHAGDLWLAQNGYDVPTMELHRGGILGRVVMSGCVNNLDSPWFFGPWGFLLEKPEPLPFYSCKGRLGLFDVDMEVEACPF